MIRAINRLKSATVATKATTKAASRSYASSFTPQTANFKLPRIENETVRSFEPGSKDRAGVISALEKYSKSTLDIPLVINGKEIYLDGGFKQVNPGNHRQVLAQVSSATESHVQDAIAGSLEAKKDWENVPWADRASIFLKAADLITGKYRYDVLATTMLGQGKNVYQAEIDATCELADFLRFNAMYAEELYSIQPARTAPGIWNRAEYRPLEGFTYAVTPFNFTAIAGNLVGAPALMGNSVVWKPSASAVLSNYVLYKIFKEAGLPDGVINFVPGDARLVTKEVLASKDFAALHFTGSTEVFVSLYQQIAQNLGHYKGYPRVVGETGGKNFHVIHNSASVEHSALSTVRGSFEYQGQKCSATSRAYVPESIWNEFRDVLVRETEQLGKTQGNAATVEGFGLFSGPVIHEASFNKLEAALAAAESDSTLELVVGGTSTKENGYFVSPTIYKTTDPNHPYLSQEFFGPLLVVYVYPDAEYESVLELADTTSKYGLTGSIFARDRNAIITASNKLRNAAGNFYINDKSTGAVVGQQWFGGARMSGTNDKAGSGQLLNRFVSVRSIKENWTELDNIYYPSNE